MNKINNKKCPICESENISDSFPAYENDNEMRVFADCDDCKKEWKFIYKLDRIVVSEPTDEEKFNKN